MKRDPIVSEPVIHAPDFHFHIVLHEPQIPPNTGNAGRLAVATNSTLHLIEPLGFSIEDKEVRRAGLDYWKHIDLKTHKSFEDWLAWHERETKNAPWYLIENNYSQTLWDVEIPKVCAFVLGKETDGIPKEIQTRYADKMVGLPMFSDKIRSLNLANTASIVLYEAIRRNFR